MDISNRIGDHDVSRLGEAIELIADKEKAAMFRNHYIECHPVILEGWDRLL